MSLPEVVVAGGCRCRGLSLQGAVSIVKIDVDRELYVDRELSWRIELESLEHAEESPGVVVAFWNWRQY